MTMTREQQSIALLDVFIKKTREGEISHTVNGKPTHTNKYLQTTSHHHPAQFGLIMSSLTQR